MANTTCCTHLIEADRTFNVAELETFINKVKLDECGLSYAVVSIVGPQSSGKSTLLNHLFGTDFKEMNAKEGRNQTTKGIWIARAAGIEPCTIVLDLEGNDGGERGEEDTSFEKLSALFALAVSDIVLINMWCTDIGRHHAANKPLLKIVIQVMLQMIGPRKTTLMFVIRDKTITPLEELEHILTGDMQRIWDSVPKRQEHKETPLNEFFNVEVVALSPYVNVKEVPEEQVEDVVNATYLEKRFKEQVVSLRQRFYHSIAPGGLAGDRRNIIPASDFSLNTQEIWKLIKENKDLNLPALKEMMAKIRCEDIFNEMYSSFVANEDWQKLEEDVRTHPVLGFWKKLGSNLDTCLSDYESAATYYEERVRSDERKKLEKKLLELVQPAYQSMLAHMLSRTLDKFTEAFKDALNGGKEFTMADCADSAMKQFDNEFEAENWFPTCSDVIIGQANRDRDEVRHKLQRDIKANIAGVRTDKLAALVTQYESELNKALSGPVEATLAGSSDDTWRAIREILKRETRAAVSEFAKALSGLEMDGETLDIMVSKLEDYARGVVKEKAKEEAGRVLILMKNRFKTSFLYDSNTIRRKWTFSVDIPAITKKARSSSLKWLCVMAAIRLDDDADNIWDVLALALLDTNECTTSPDPLASMIWEEVPESETLISPVMCRALWRQFQEETENLVDQAIAAKEADRLRIQNNIWQVATPMLTLLFREAVQFMLKKK